MREGGKILIYGHHLLLLMEVVAGGDARIGSTDDASCERASIMLVPAASTVCMLPIRSCLIEFYK